MSVKTTQLLSALLAIAFLSPLSCAQDRTPIRLIDDAALSPDGERMVFSWRGDIWTASGQGGAARRLTFHPAADSQPCFSPDGQEVAFVSRRTGSSQVFTMPAEGGSPKQVTLNTAGYRLFEWAPDGKGFLVGGTRDHFWRRAQRLFIQARDGKRAPQLMFDDYGDNATLSADGTRLLFTREQTRMFRKGYHGPNESQVWQLDRETGALTQLQGQGQGGCRWPLWTGDGEYVYVNQSTGTWNLFEGRTGTSAPRQLTRFEDDGVMFPAVSRDGSTVVFMRLFDLYRLELSSGDVKRLEIWDEGDPTVAATRKVVLNRATEATFTGDGREMAFISGGDLWVMDTVLKEPVRVTHTPEEERSPVFSKDMKSVWFIGDTGGQTDIWRVTRGDDKKFWWQNHHFKLEKLTDDPDSESGLRLWHDGKNLAFVRSGGDLMSMDLESGKTTRLIASWNTPGYDFSPDWKWIVYSVSDADYNSDVWIKPLDGSSEPYNVSVHPDGDRGPVWSADGKVIAWTGRRWGTETDIAYAYVSKEQNEETKRQRTLEKALEKMKGRKKKGAKGKGSGKGKADKPAAPRTSATDVSGTWRGEVEGPENVIPGGSFEVTFELSMKPDGSVTGSYSSATGTNGSITGKFDQKSRKIHLEATTDDGTITVDGTLEGKKFSGQWELADFGVGGTWWAAREGEPATSEKAAPEAAAGKKEGKKKGDEDEKKPKPVKVDLDGLRDRVKRISNPNSFEGSLRFAPKDAKLYFRASVRGKSGMYTVEFPDKLTPKFWTSSIGGMRGWLENGSLQGTARGLPATVSKAGKTETYGFRVEDEVDVAARNQAIFDAAWRTMRDRFYDERLGNRDWDRVREKYRGAAKTLDTDDVRIIGNMMLGELNASHTGFSIFARGGSGGATDQWRPETGHLGTRLDPAWKGPGLKVKDVVTGSPASRADSRIEPGEVILSIDGQSVSPEIEIATAMTGHRQRDVRVHVRGQDGKERDVTLRPTTYGRVRSLMYEDWMRANRKKVDELSGGTLGYLHIQGMGQRNLLRFDAELYKIGHGKDGLVIDVRENGGGSITDHLLTCLCQPAHAITRGRGGSEGYPQDRRVYASWSKPIIVLCNQNSFSNAEIFSHAIKTLKRGKVVGVTTGGGVISTGGTMLFGMASLRLPGRGWYLMDGQDMELNGCVPDVELWPLPGEMPSGIDRQLDKAVSLLLDDVRAWKARPRPKLIKASERK